MAFIVLALGALMAVAGSYEVYFGNTYISVERGWSAFISGTVLLTGGLITFALGLAMRSLADLKTALVSAALASAGGPQVTAGHDGAASTRAEPVPSLDPFEAAPYGTEASPSLEKTPTPAPPTLAAVEPAPMPAPVNMVSEPPVASVERPDVEQPDIEQLDAEPPAFGAERAPRLRPAVSAETTRPSRPMFSLRRERPAVSGAAEEPALDWRQEHTVLPPLQAKEPDAALQTSSTETSPPMDDWLDRSFADLERDMAAGQIRPTTPREPANSFDVRAEAATYVEVAELASPHVEQVAPADPIPPAVETLPTRSLTRTAPAPQPASAPPAAPAPVAASPVIGRYESDGTSYIMYADGSIEAQSEAGVYRFASMSELKSFLET